MKFQGVAVSYVLLYNYKDIYAPDQIFVIPCGSRSDLLYSSYTVQDYKDSCPLQSKWLYECNAYYYKYSKLAGRYKAGMARIYLAMHVLKILNFSMQIANLIAITQSRSGCPVESYQVTSYKSMLKYLLIWNGTYLDNKIICIDR